jgi:hypothetical protein
MPCRLSLWVGLILALSGCARRPLQPPAAFKPTGHLPASDYIDLSPGWRVRVTTPIWRSGAGAHSITAAQSRGSTITLKAGPELEGYEVAFYAVEAHRSVGVRVRFMYCEVTKNGQTMRQEKPCLPPLLAIPARMRFVRLLYLARLTEVEHDMALLAANSMNGLNTLTADIRNQPDACTRAGDRLCFWTPAGVAVVPEMRTNAAGAELWRPVR